tara:strand:+ start:469 stop:636 length:168 start_codon:yes stop_codon:yes gene_type:complete
MVKKNKKQNTSPLFEKMTSKSIKKSETNLFTKVECSKLNTKHLDSVFFYKPICKL